MSGLAFFDTNIPISADDAGQPANGTLVGFTRGLAARKAFGVNRVRRGRGFWPGGFAQALW
jgi:hypothetical protein